MYPIRLMCGRRAAVLVLAVLVLLCSAPVTRAWQLELEDAELTVYMDESEVLAFNLTAEPDVDSSELEVVLVEVVPADVHVATVSGAADAEGGEVAAVNVSVLGGWGAGAVTVHGVFLGRTRLQVRLAGGGGGVLGEVSVAAVRRPRALDRAFTASVAVLVTLIYVNFGCALDWAALRALARRPVGPALGLLGQFGAMPALAYALGLLLFPGEPALRLGLLFAGASPGGGASNVWTCVLDGNLALSVAMTSASTLAAFACMPLWLFTLGPRVFAEARVAVPYAHVATLAAALALPLAAGWLLQRRAPRLAAAAARWLKLASALLILFIVLFAVVANLYLFRLGTLRIAAAGLLLPAAGYVVGATLALLARRPARDVIAIAVETGVQNTGIAIFLLRFSLPQPEADRTTVVPVACACMTPLPLALLYLVRRFCTSAAVNKQGPTATTSPPSPPPPQEDDQLVVGVHL